MAKLKIDQAWFEGEFAAAGLSGRALAPKLGMDQASLSRVLTGDRKLQIQEAIDLARILGIPLREILLRAGYSLKGIAL